MRANWLLPFLTALPLACAVGPKTTDEGILEPIAAPTSQVAPSQGAVLPTSEPATKGLLYTTYFYTAKEAIIHGYEDDTSARIVSISDNTTIWKGTVKRGQTVLVPTGQGVYGFMSDKKASILVGTPSSCTVVGYFVKNQEGSFRSKQFFAQLPSQISSGSGVKLLTWAWEDTKFHITDRTGDKLLYEGKLKAGEFYEIEQKDLGALSGHVLEFEADKDALSVQVYYDEGFVVPSKDGRASGKIFYTYVGDITEKVNDLILMSYDSNAKIKVEDLKSKEIIFDGTVKPGTVEAITLSKRYVKVTSDVEISVGVGPYKHYKAGYAEHHFSMGAEGTGIENNFLVTTPGELWIFSYYDSNNVKVINKDTGAQIWSGKLNAGGVQGLTPGYGFFQVTSDTGISVMGGASSCGGEYSPAGGLFTIDEEIYSVVKEIREERKNKAKSEGRVATEEELSAPMAAPEIQKAQDNIIKRTGKKNAPSAKEIQDRADSMQQ